MSEEDLELGSGKTAFIIGPIGDSLDAIGSDGRARYEEGVQMWEKVFQPVCAAFGLEAVRADKISAPGEIPEQIFLALRDSDVVIADLSHGNPNVMYELGLRHSKDRITLQVGEQGRLPFDINTVRTIRFRRTEAALIDLRVGLETSLRAALRGEGTPTTATRIWKESVPVDPAMFAKAALESARPDEEIDIADEVTLMEMLAEGEAGLHEVSGHLADAVASTKLIGNLSSEATNSLRESDGAGRGFAGRLLVTRKLAADISEPVATYEANVELYFAALSAADAMTQYVLRRIKDDPEERSAQTKGYLDTLEALIDAAEGSEEGITGYIRSVAAWKKLSKDLAGPARTIERAGHRLIEGIAIISGWRGPIAEARTALEAGD